MPQDPLQNDIFYKWRKVISSILLCGISFLYIGAPIAQAADPVQDVNVVNDPLIDRIPTNSKITNWDESAINQKVNKGEGISVSDGFSNLFTDPLKTLYSGLQTFDYKGTLDLVLRGALNKVIDNFYNNVVTTFEKEYRIKDWLVDSWSPAITEGFEKFHGWVIEKTGGKMQAPFLKVMLGLEQSYYNRALATGRAVNRGILEDLQNLIGASTNQATPKTVGNYVGTPAFFMEWAGSAGNSAFERMPHILGKMEEISSDAIQQANMEALTSDMYSKKGATNGTPGTANTILNKTVKLGEKLKFGEITSDGQLHRNLVEIEDKYLVKWGYPEITPCADLKDTNGLVKGSYKLCFAPTTMAVGNLFVWSFYLDQPVKIFFGSPTSNDYTIREIKTMKLESNVWVDAGQELPNFTFTSRVNDPGTSGWTGLIARPGTTVKNMINGILDKRLGTAAEANNLTGVAKVISEVMNGFTEAISFKVKRNTDPDSAMYGCPVGFEGSVKDLTSEIGPFAGQTSDFGCIAKAWNEYGWGLLDDVLDYVSCLGKKLLCWIFQVDPNAKTAGNGVTYEMVPDPDAQSYDPDAKKVGLFDADGNPDPNGKPKEVPGGENKTESILQLTAQYFIYTQLIKPHLPDWQGATKEYLDKFFDAMIGTGENSWIDDVLKGINGILGFVVDLGGDFMATWATQKLVKIILGWFGWCEDCHESPVAPPGDTTPGTTCEELCVANPDSIVYTGKYKVYYREKVGYDGIGNVLYNTIGDGVVNGPLRGVMMGDDAGYSTSTTGPEKIVESHLKFEACNCASDVAVTLVGWKPSLSTKQQIFENSLLDSNQKVSVLAGDYHNIPNSNARGVWARTTMAYIPFGEGASAVNEGLRVDVGSEAVPRQIAFHLETKKIDEAGTAQNYKNDYDISLPVAALTFFDVVDGFDGDRNPNSGDITFGQDQLPHMTVKDVSNNTVANFIERGKEYSLNLYLRNKTGMTFEPGNQQTVAGSFPLTGKLKLAPIGPDSLEVAKRCVTITTSTPGQKVDFKHMGQMPNTYDSQMAMMWRNSNYDQRSRRLWFNYLDAQASLEAQPAGSSEKDFGPNLGMPAFDENLDGGPALPGYFSPEQFFRGIDSESFKEGFFNSYVMRHWDGTPVSEAEFRSFAWKAVKVGATVYIAHGNYVKVLLGYGLKWAFKKAKGDPNVAPPAPAGRSDYDIEYPTGYNTAGAQTTRTEQENVLGATVPQVLSFDHSKNLMINNNREDFQFKITNDAFCQNKVIPFVLYLRRGNDNVPIGVLPIWWKIGEPQINVTLPQCSDGLDNDGDGTADATGVYEGGVLKFPLDPGCSGPNDNDEHGTAQCDDGRDNDSDGKADFKGAVVGSVTYPADPDCTSLTDTSEAGAVADLPDLTDGVGSNTWYWLANDNDNNNKISLGDEIALRFRVKNIGEDMSQPPKDWKVEFSYRYGNDSFSRINSWTWEDNTVLGRNTEKRFDFNESNGKLWEIKKAEIVCFNFDIDVNDTIDEVTNNNNKSGNYCIPVAGNEPPEPEDCGGLGEVCCATGDECEGELVCNDHDWCDNPPQEETNDLEVKSVNFKNLQITPVYDLIESAYTLHNNGSSTINAGYSVQRALIRVNAGCARDDQGCCNIQGNPYSDNSGASVRLFSDEENDQHFNITKYGGGYLVNGNYYQIRIWTNYNNDDNMDNNVGCSNVLTAGVSSAFNPNYTQNIAGASETPAPLTLGQRIGRVWGYLGTLLH